MAEKLIIIGMGNPIASDDAIGLVITDRLEKIYSDNPRIETRSTGQGGLSILDYITGYDHAIIIDAIRTGKHEPGTIIRFSPEDYDFSPRGTVLHDVSLFQAIELGRKLSLKVPDKIDILAIEVIDIVNVAERLNPEIEKAIEPCIKIVEKIVEDLKFC